MNTACKETFEGLKNDVNILFDNIGGYLKESLQSSTEWFNHKVKSMFVCGKDSPTLGDHDVGQDLKEVGEDVKTEFANFGNIVKEWGENLRANVEDWGIGIKTDFEEFSQDKTKVFQTLFTVFTVLAALVCVITIKEYIFTNSNDHDDISSGENEERNGDKNEVNSGKDTVDAHLPLVVEEKVDHVSNGENQESGEDEN